MKKNNFKHILALIFTLLMCLSINLNTFGDLGDFNDYNSDSGWDSSGWDWGDDANSDWDWNDNDDDYYYYGGGNHYRSGGGGSGLSTGTIILIIIIILIVSYANRNKSNTANSTGNKSRPAQPTPSNAQTHSITDNTEEISKAITEIDPNFSSDAFISWAKEVFFTLQYAWSARDFSTVRPFEKEELYNQHIRQIEQYKATGKINVLERININNAFMYKYVRDNEYEYLTLFLNTRMVDYIKDEKTGQILKGNPNTDCYPKYLYTFMRKTGVKTEPGLSNKSVTNCPNCGAPTQITSSGKCDYCDSVITTGEFDWVLSNIEGVKKNVDITEGGVFIRATKND